MEKKYVLDNLGSQDIVDLMFGLKELQNRNDFNTERLKATEARLMKLLLEAFSYSNVCEKVEGNPDRQDSEMLNEFIQDVKVQIDDLYIKVGLLEN